MCTKGRGCDSWFCFRSWLQKVALGCAHLEEALCLLKDAGQPPISPILEQEIQEALVDFKPDCTLEHLKVSLSCSSIKHAFLQMKE